MESRLDLTELLLRTASVFFVLYVWCRVVGKKLISQMTFFDYVAGITIGAISASIIFTKDVTLLEGIFSQSLFVLLVLASGFLVMKSRKGKKLLEGEPLLIVKNGDVQEDAMKRSRLSMTDLLKMLRGKDVFYLDEVEYAVFETDGTISVLKKAGAMSITRRDLKLDAVSRGLPMLVAMEGRPMDGSFISEHKDEDWLRERLRAQGVDRLEDVSIAQLDEQERLHVDTRTESEQ